MIDIKENISLKRRNSFGIEARAKGMFEYETAFQLREYFALHDPRTHLWYPFSGGNNVLFTEDYQGTLLHSVARGMEIIDSGPYTVTVKVAGGTEWDDFVEWSVRHGFGGVENLSLIPGHVGAAPIQNIGAYGVEAGDKIQSVEVLMVETGEVVNIPASECGFAYRDSIFKRELKGKAIILFVTFKLYKEPIFRLDYGDLQKEVEERGGATLQNVRDAVIAIRESKLPDPKVIGNAGSFFKNPVVGNSAQERLSKEYPEMPFYVSGPAHSKLAAGWLIDKAGWKGRRKGEVGVHEKQALVIVNYGRATGREVLGFAQEVRAGVKEKFGIDIEMEVNVL